MCSKNGLQIISQDRLKIIPYNGMWISRDEKNRCYVIMANTVNNSLIPVGRYKNLDFCYSLIQEIISALEAGKAEYRMP